MPGRARTILAILIAGLLAGLIPAIVVSHLEEDNRFCASCHRPSEVRYVNQAEQATPDYSPNLAAFHYAVTVRGEWEEEEDDEEEFYQSPGGATRRVVNCVACHRGDQSLRHRAIALTLGARNTVKWLLGDEGTQAVGRSRFDWLPNASCTRCHEEAIDDQDFENHYHFYLPEYNADPVVRADADANALYCSDCHVSHRDIPQELDFLSEEIVFPACDRCHIVWQRGPQGDLN